MCHQCQSTGWVVAVSKKDFNIFGFRCACSAGNRYSRIIPEWNSRMKSKFHPDYEIPLIPEKAPPVKPVAEYSADDLPF
jgi:hypothetical protein